MPATAAAMRIDPGETVRAIEWLKRTADLTGAGALEYLDELVSSNNILSVYRRMFGALYQTSTAPTCGRDSYYTGHSPKEAEFLRLIAKHYFPLPEDVGWEDHGGHYDQIPVSPLQGDAWCCGDYQLEELHSCYYVALCLLHGSDYWEQAADRYDLEESARTTAGNVDFERFRALCREEPTPLRHLPLAMEMTCYETGNEWLDSNFCMSQPYYPWTIPNVLRLAREQREALLAFDWMDDLSRHLDEHPREAIRRALELWNGAAAGRNKDGVSGGGPS